MQQSVPTKNVVIGQLVFLIPEVPGLNSGLLARYNEKQRCLYRKYFWYYTSLLISTLHVDLTYLVTSRIEDKLKSKLGHFSVSQRPSDPVASADTKSKLDQQDN
jgi:hypothetical protein